VDANQNKGLHETRSAVATILKSLYARISSKPADRIRQRLLDLKYDPYSHERLSIDPKLLARWDRIRLDRLLPRRLLVRSPDDVQLPLIPVPAKFINSGLRYSPPFSSKSSAHAKEIPTRLSK